MSNFVDNLSHFLSDCRNDILQEACDNDDYVDLKNKATEMSERLQNSVPSEYRTLLNDFLDALAAIGSMEDSYCYLCGLRDSNKPESQYNPLAKDTPSELAAYKPYADSELKRAEKYNELKTCIDTECLGLLDEYIETKNIILGIEKSYCYPGGLRDKKRLDNQFNPSIAKEWSKLINAFL